MLVLDTNVLLDAANEESDFHERCLRWVDRSRRDPSPTFLTWNICYEFMRVSTHPRVLSSPWSPLEAWNFVETLLGSPGLALLRATHRHQAVLTQTLSEMPHVRGNVVHDLHTAVLMREHGIVRICTRDTDFHRFPFLEVVDPLRQDTYPR